MSEKKISAAKDRNTLKIKLLCGCGNVGIP